MQFWLSGEAIPLPQGGGGGVLKLGLEPSIMMLMPRRLINPGQEVLRKTELCSLLPDPLLGYMIQTENRTLLTAPRPTPWLYDTDRKQNFAHCSQTHSLAI